MVRIYAWRMLLGREGLINEGLQRIGIIDQPIDALLFSKFAVIVVLSTSYLTYTVSPIYGAMKAIDKNLFEAALDSDDTDVIRDQLGQFADALDADHELQVFFFSPYFSTQEKKDGLHKAVDGAEPIFLNFLELLLENWPSPLKPA